MHEHAHFRVVEVENPSWAVFDLVEVSYVPHGNMKECCTYVGDGKRAGMDVTHAFLGENLLE